MPPTTPTPFQQGRFEDLPDKPRKPHPYFDAKTRSVPVTTPALGAGQANVVVHGAGPPLLLVHGLMTSSYSWRYVLAPLGERFTVYVPDLPGAGKSDPAPSYGPQDIADWLSALQMALGIRGCAVVGNSMGGYLCMRLALRDPGAMGRLLNVHSPGIPELRLDALRALLALPSARSLLAWWVRRDVLRWAHGNVHYFDESLKSLEEAHAYGDVLATDAGMRAFIGYLGETMNVGPIREFRRTLLDRKAKGQPFPVPLQHLYARRDPMVPARFGAMLADLTGAPLTWLDRGSHFAHVDAVDAFLPPALAFLEASAG